MTSARGEWNIEICYEALCLAVEKLLPDATEGEAFEAISALVADARNTVARQDAHIERLNRKYVWDAA